MISDQMSILKHEPKDECMWRYYVFHKKTPLLTAVAVFASLVLFLQMLYSGKSCTHDQACALLKLEKPAQSSSSTNELKILDPVEAAAMPQESKLIKSQASQLKEVRHFEPHGLAAYLFVHMGSYRGGPRTFATVGLASKPLHVFGKPYFMCEWKPTDAGSNTTAEVKGWAILPDWGYGRAYTVVVVNCTFEEDIGVDGGGGELIIHAYPGDDYGKPARVPVLKESTGQYNASVFDPPYPYDYLYCGSSLFGNLNPQRMREWMAHHARVFGPRSHFVFHDAGGIHPGVQKVLEPWVKAGKVTIQDIREQARYDGYYYNQFLIVNDCLHRYRFKADWTFFFDVDEYIYTPPGVSLADALRDVANYTQFTFEQRPMSNKLCLATENASHSSLSSEWGMEKLVFRNVKKGVRLDRKYAIRGRNAFATGVHMSENIVGQTTHSKRSKIQYYHYHNTITVKGELCQEFVSPQNNTSTIWRDKIPYTYDGSMIPLTAFAKQFESDQFEPQQSSS